MTAEELILCILRTLPSHSVKGKKRLQKFVFLLKQAGVECSAQFAIRNFGPFSPAVETASASLTLFGDVEQREVIMGYANYLATEYFLSHDSEGGVVLPPPMSSVLSRLDAFATIDLEVASTILFFEREGLDRRAAIQRTKYLKPTKVNEKTLQSSDEILKIIAARAENVAATY